MSKPLTRYVCGYDLHYPKYDKPAFNAMLALVEDIKPDGFIFGGDAFDNEEISHHTKNKPLYRERGAFRRNTVGFEENILTPLETVLPKGCEKVYIIGNHERFEYDLIEEQPELEWMVDHVTLLNLEKRGWEIIPLGHAKKIGKLNVIHGEVLTGIGNQAGAFPSKKAVEIYGSNVLAGHTHAPQSFTKVSPVDHKNKHMAHIAPILGNCNPTYLRNRATAWVNGFVVVEVYGKGNFNLYSVIVSEGQCAYGGKLYDAKSR